MKISLEFRSYSCILHLRISSRVTHHHIRAVLLVPCIPFEIAPIGPILQNFPIPSIDRFRSRGSHTGNLPDQVSADKRRVVGGRHFW